MTIKHLALCIAALLLAGLTANVMADDSQFRLVVSRNSGVASGRFHVDLEIKVSTTSRTLNSLTIDIPYSPELAAFGSNPDSNWFAGSADYEASVNKLGTAPPYYYRVLVTGNAIGKAGAGTPAGFNVTAAWQRVVTLRWTIATLSNSYQMSLSNVTDAAAYFDNIANNPVADLSEWETVRLPPPPLNWRPRPFCRDRMTLPLMP